jgi:hypothetical protein
MVAEVRNDYDSLWAGVNTAAEKLAVGDAETGHEMPPPRCSGIVTVAALAASLSSKSVV